MNITNAQKVRMSLALKDKNITWLATQTGISKQNLSNKLSRDSLSIEELQKIAAALGGVYVYGFEFPDGTKI